MIRTSRLFLILGMAGSCAIPACGGDDGSTSSGPGALSTGLPKDEVVGSFSDADAQQFCRAVGDYVAKDPNVRAAECRLGGLGAAAGAAFFGSATDADVQKACSNFEAACLSASQNADAGTSSCHKPTGTCTTTVSEFEACLSDSLSALEGAVAQVPSCSSLKVADVTPGTSDGGGAAKVQDPASCAVVRQKCPDGLASTGVASSPATGSSAGL